MGCAAPADDDSLAVLQSGSDEICTLTCTVDREAARRNDWPGFFAPLRRGAVALGAATSCLAQRGRGLVREERPPRAARGPGQLPTLRAAAQHELELSIQMSASAPSALAARRRSSAGRVALRLRMSRETYRWWRSGGPGSALAAPSCELAPIPVPVRVARLAPSPRHRRRVWAHLHPRTLPLHEPGLQPPAM